MKKTIAMLTMLAIASSLIACNNTATVEQIIETVEETKMLESSQEETVNEIQNAEVNVMPKKIADYVYEIPIYDSIDYKFAEDFASKQYDGWAGACTAVAKKTDEGKLIVGRNMDLYISNKPAYIVRTKVDGDYETIGLSYTNKTGPDNNDIEKAGLSEDFIRVAPFLCTDVFNEKGLYIETNMRNGEYYPNGANEYGCTGTNPGAERVCSFVLPRYIGQRCATVKEAVEFVKNLDIYTPKAVGMDWNFCFMLADATGDYGIMEIAQNEISWLQDEPAQTNFYLTKKFQITEQLPAGIGRYQLVTENRDNVKNEQDMYDLIRRVSYSKVYDPANCEFDVRSEFVAIKDFVTYDVISNPEIKDYVYEELIKFCEPHSKKTRQQLQDEGKSWESTFTEVVNCTDKTWKVRFFEDENRVVNLSFD